MSTSATATPASWAEVDAMPVEPEATADPADTSPPEDTAEASQPGEAEAGSQSETGEPSAQAPAEPAKDPATTAEQPKQDHRPFAFTVDRTRREVPGAVETEDGWIAIPRTSWDKHVQPNLRDPAAWQRERNQMQAQLTEARNLEKLPEYQRTKLFAGEIDRLKSVGVEGVVQWAIDFLQNLPVLEAKAEAAAAKSQLQKHTTQQSDAAHEQAVQTLAAELPKTLRSEVDDLLKVEFAGLGLNAEELSSLLWDFRKSIFFEAEEDMPEAGLAKGDIGYHKDVIHRLVKRQADAVRGARDSATKANAARAHNDKVLNPPQTPPAVTAKSGDAPAGRKPSKPKSKEEWEASLYAKD